MVVDLWQRQIHSVCLTDCVSRFSRPRSWLFFVLLTELMGKRYSICPKVSLNDVFYIVRPNENVHFFNKFFRKHVDFLLCDRQTLAPAFGVEIVRRQSSKGEARESDKFLEDLFTDAGLPLVHIPSSESYDPSEVITLFQLAVTKIGGNWSPCALNVPLTLCRIVPCAAR